MRVLGLVARIDRGRPQLELRNEGLEPVTVTKVALQRISKREVASALMARGGIDYGKGPFLMFPSNLTIPADESWQSGQNGRGFSSNPEADSASEWLEQAQRFIVASTEEVVIRIHVDLDPPQQERDQVAPSFFVVRRHDGQITDFFALQGSLQGQPSMLDALLENRRHGT
jgi:hypothetical protein